MKIAIILLFSFCAFGVIDGSILSRLERIHKAVQLIKTIVHPNASLAHLVPEAKGLVFEKVKKCYNATIGSESVDIFHLSIGQVLRKFIEFNYHLIIVQDHDIMRKRIHNVLQNIRVIARSVIKCSLNRNSTYRPTLIGLNSFSVYSRKEARAKFSKPMNNDFPEMKPLGARPRPTKPKLHSCLARLVPEDYRNLPQSFDWRSKGAVTGVKHQGDCGSCYAFAAIGALEASYQIQIGNQKVNDSASKAVPEFSEQDIINCYHGSDGTKGCDNGLPHQVIQMAMNRGLVLGTDLQYKGKPDQCTADVPRLPAKPLGFCLDAKLDETKMKALLRKFGPLIIGFDAEGSNFMALKGAYNEECPKGVADHSVLLVGWQEDSWIVKNSYGKDWGVDGYLLVPIEHAQKCAMFQFAIAPFFVEKAGETTTQKSAGFWSKLWG